MDPNSYFSILNSGLSDLKSVILDPESGLSDLRSDL